MMRFVKLAALVLAFVAALSIASIYGASYYYTSQRGQGCASCHEMAAYTNAVHASVHGKATCMDCHEAGLSTKLRHIRVHILGNAPETIRLRDTDVLAMTTSCQKCHQHEYASWHAGPHSATYTQIFANPTHNTQRRLMDDCLRCHGMHFNGAVRELVQPQNATGPWHITRANFADKPTMPCMACHQMHREGAAQTKPATRISATLPLATDSLAIYDRREQMHFAVRQLALPKLSDGPRAVKISPDQRQALCYQCHAPRQPEANSVAASNHYGPQFGSGDDRTPVGVHEGISCLACHASHNENATASCKTCHPQMSHCGIDVEKMDTTFASARSAHNIHWVRCTDCHQHGIPKLKTAVQRAQNASVSGTTASE